MRRFTSGLVALVAAETLALEPTAIRWEAEKAVETNMRTNGPYSPRNAAAEAILSGGAWLNGRQTTNAAPAYASYRIEVPVDSTYQFYVRKFWHHGPFRYRVDDADWVKVANQPPILDSATLAPNIPACWIRAGQVVLAPGEHVLRIETLVGEAYQFSGNYGYDCFLLYNGGEIPEGKDGLKTNTVNTFGKLKPMSPEPAEGWRPTLVVDPRQVNADDANAGTADAPLRTLNAAAQRAQPGDIVLVAPGIYRESIEPVNSGTEEKPIRYIASPGGTVTVSGSEVWSPSWHPAADMPGVFAARFYPSLFRDDVNPFLQAISIAPRDEKKAARPCEEFPGTLLPRSLGQVFVNGMMYTQARSMALLKTMPGSWMASLDGTELWVNFLEKDQPKHKPAVEVSVRQQLFCPARDGLAFIQVKGFTFEHAANPGPFPQLGMVSVRGGHHWRIEDNAIRFANTIGLDCGKKGNHLAGYNVIEGNTISDNGLCGIAGIGRIGTQIRGNILERNNLLDFDTPEADWLEWAAIKVHMSEDAVIEGNLIRDNECFGIWLDNQYRNARLTRNVVVGNKMAGIFFELGDGPALVDHNIVALTRKRGTHYNGDGIYAHDASGLTVAHNLICDNAGDGVRMIVLTDRHTGGHPVRCSHQRILNNIIVGNGGAAVSLPAPGPRAQDNRSDHNYLFGAREYWEGLDQWPALMAVNRFKGEISREDVVEALRRALTETKIPESSWPNLQTWSKNPVLGLSQWQSFMKQDLHSTESSTELTLHLRPRQFLIEVKVNSKFLERVCPQVEGVDRDFFGNPLPADALRPGPFQTLSEGINQFPLWPNPL